MTGSSRRYVDNKIGSVKAQPSYYSVKDKIKILGGRKCSDNACPDNFYIGQAVGDGSCFFDSFRQGLEEEKGIKVTVKQLRRDCAEFAKSNPPQWFINGISQNYYDSNFVNKETPSEYVKNIGSNNRWGNPEIEGRILCEKYDVDLHIVERIEYPKEALKQWNDMKRKGEVSGDLQKYGYSAVGTQYDKVTINNEQVVSEVISADKAYSMKNVIRVINTGSKHFEPLLDVNKSFDQKFNKQNKENSKIATEHSKQENYVSTKNLHFEQLSDDGKDVKRKFNGQNRQEDESHRKIRRNEEGYKTADQSNKKEKSSASFAMKRIINQPKLKGQKNEFYKKRKSNEESDIPVKRFRREEEDFELAKRLQQEEDDFMLARRLQEKEDFKFAKQFQQEEDDFMLARRLQEKEDVKFAKKFQWEENNPLLARHVQAQEKEIAKPLKKCKEQDQANNVWKNKVIEENSKSPTIKGRC